MRKIVFLMFVLALLFLSACKVAEVNVSDKKVDAPIIGGDRDEHGCIASAGYTWCESKQKCLRLWEEECPGLEKPGSKQKSKHAEKKKAPETCRKEGETGFGPCCEGLTAVACYAENDCNIIGTCGTVCVKCGDGVCGPGENQCVCPRDCLDMEKMAKQFLAQKNVSEVAICGDYIKVVRGVQPNTGTTYYRGNAEFHCVGKQETNYLANVCKEIANSECKEIK
ncbi:hypothetical protein DRJ22_01575 [Candidatus Woesearchaeota archaeon]|nr:MAG: hypothetical protein DRJ22_01575 [Candidatus Woesearchaeota archaeon]